jgi:hypothetical protein
MTVIGGAAAIGITAAGEVATGTMTMISAPPRQLAYSASPLAR